MKNSASLCDFCTSFLFFRLPVLCGKFSEPILMKNGKLEELCRGGIFMKLYKGQIQKNYERRKSSKEHENESD